MSAAQSAMTVWRAGAAAPGGAGRRCRYPVRHAALLAALWLAVAAAPARGQNRGVYPLGLSAINSGITPSAGFGYTNSFLFYSRSEEKGGNGETLATGQQSVLMDMNTFAWASATEIAALGGARFSCAATLPLANNSLSSSAQGAISGGGGFADSYYQPLIFGWRRARAEWRVIYGFLAPTGRFNAGASDNVGSGYWTSVVAAGETFYLSADQATALSLFQMYEFHGTQSGTHIQPGETLDLDYSLMHTLSPLTEGARLQLGLVGYGQWQTTATTGPGITATEAARRYRVNGLGAGLNVLLPGRKVSLSLKYFDEFSNHWTYQGYSVQISAGVVF